MGISDEKQGGQRSPGLGTRLEKIRAALFYAALTIEVLVVLIDKSDLVNPWESYFFRLTFVLTVLVVLLSERTAKQWVLLALAAGVGVISYRITGRNEILRIVLFVAACQGRPRQKMLRVMFWETAAGSLLILLLSVTGLFGNQSLTMLYRARVGEETRWCLGFGHPNALHTMFMMLVLLGMLAYDGYLKWWHYALLFLANLGLYRLTDSRIGMAMTALFLIAGICLQFQEKKWPAHAWRGKKWPYVTGELVLLACCTFSVWAAWVSYQEWTQPIERMQWVVNLDLKLTQRISDLYWASEHAGLDTWKLFSSPSAQRYFDMGWCRLFYWYGILPGVLAVLALLWLMDWCRKHRDLTVLLVITGLSVYTVVEAHLVSVYIGRNALLLILGAALAERAAQGGGRVYGLIPAKLRGYPEERKTETGASHGASEGGGQE